MEESRPEGRSVRSQGRTSALAGGDPPSVCASSASDSFERLVSPPVSTPTDPSPPTHPPSHPLPFHVGLFDPQVGRPPGGLHANAAGAALWGSAVRPFSAPLPRPSTLPFASASTAQSSEKDDVCGARTLPVCHVPFLRRPLCPRLLTPCGTLIPCRRDEHRPARRSPTPRLAHHLTSPPRLSTSSLDSFSLPPACSDASAAQSRVPVCNDRSSAMYSQRPRDAPPGAFPSRPALPRSPPPLLPFSFGFSSSLLSSFRRHASSLSLLPLFLPPDTRPLSSFPFLHLAPVHEPSPPSVGIQSCARCCVVSAPDRVAERLVSASACPRDKRTVSGHRFDASGAPCQCRPHLARTLPRRCRPQLLHPLVSGLSS